MIEIQAEDGDAAAFITKTEAIARGIATHYSPPEMLIVRIDNWFGPRWLGFSGKILGALGIWKKSLTLPPFVPNRVVWEHRFVAPDYAQMPMGSPLHITVSGPQAVQRYISEIAPGKALLWFSGQSDPNGRAAAMAYLPMAEGYWTWYAAWSRKADWRATTLEGISASELTDLSKSD